MAERRPSFDLIVIGAGGAGMSAAPVGAIEGLDVLVVESSALVGSTTAFSAGSVWVPNSRHSPAGADSFENALRYLDATVGAHAPEAMRIAFLTHAPAMVDCLETHSDVRLQAYRQHPDYLADAEGATLSGRALQPLPFDGRRLGADFSRLRPPLPEFTLLGGMMVDRADIAHLLNASRSFASLSHAARLLGRHALDRVRWRRGTRLVMGNALAARLFHSLRRRKVPVWTECRVVRLIADGKEVAGVGVQRAGETTEIAARAGVVLATGGFSHNAELRERLFPTPLSPYSAFSSASQAGGIGLGLEAGAHLGSGHASNAFFSPVSVRRRADGSTAVFPHFVLDRGKPGLIAINAAGRGFANEATSYQLFAQAIYEAHRTTPSIPCFFVCDASFLHRYGLGMVRPRAPGRRRFVREGYLIEAQTIERLAGRLAAEPGALTATVERNNAFARTGEDADFGKGRNAYERNLGDPAHGPNPCLGPIERAPFYAIRVYPGDIGTSCGLVADEHARVLDRDGAPIGGLYACGNDMDSIMGGIYPAPGDHAWAGHDVWLPRRPPRRPQAHLTSVPRAGLVAKGGPLPVSSKKCRGPACPTGARAPSRSSRPPSGSEPGRGPSSRSIG